MKLLIFSARSAGRVLLHDKRQINLPDITARESYRRFKSDNLVCFTIYRYSYRYTYRAKLQMGRKIFSMFSYKAYGISVRYTTLFPVTKFNE